jgi:hypothetical protein
VYVTVDDFLGLRDHKGSYKDVSDFERLRSYDRLKLRTEGKGYREYVEYNIRETHYLINITSNVNFME